MIFYEIKTCDYCCNGLVEIDDNPSVDYQRACEDEDYYNEIFGLVVVPCPKCNGSQAYVRKLEIKSFIDAIYISAMKDYIGYTIFRTKKEALENLPSGF